MCGKTLSALLTLVVFWISRADGARILGLFPTDTRSHYMMYGKLMSELALRGHQVTVLSQFPKDQEMENFRDVVLKGSPYEVPTSVDYLLGLSHIGNQLDIIKMCLDVCDAVLNAPEILDVIKEKDFDLFITEIFGSDCFLAVGKKLNIPTIGVVSSVALPWVNDMVSNPDNPSYIPLYFLPFSENMNIVERAYNSFMNVLFKIHYDLYSNWPSQTIIEGVFGAMPPLKEITKNYSIILVNSHHSINQVRPTVPQLVEVGGLHIPKQVGKLPQDFELFLNNSMEQGVIYFSLGSIIPVDTMSKEKLESIVYALGRLKETVLWKANASDIPNLPPNVKTNLWMPQLEILCHPAVKLFIAHGGLLGLQEAIHCGVPVLGIPMFADQANNLAQAQHKGFARMLQFNDLNGNSFLTLINEMLKNERYSKSAQHASSVFKDRPTHPLDLAVYWIEYVIKYKGAEHLKLHSTKLRWYQNILLDVIFIAVICAVVLLSLLFYTLKNIIRLIRNIYKPKSDASINNGRLKKD